jgi:phosphoesterase RecJ-like protein
MARGGDKMDSMPVGTTGGLELLGEVAKIIDKRDKFLILGHTSPDADSLGSVAALSNYLKGEGKDVIAFASGKEPLPSRLSFLDLSSFVRDIPGDFGERVVIVLDCALLANTGLSENLDSAREVIQLDHHVTDNQKFASLNVLAHTSSASEIVAILIKRLGYLKRVEKGFSLDEAPDLHKLIDSNTATYLYAGIVSDTGRFRYDNTTPDTLEIAAQLMKAGANPAEIAESLFQETPFRKLKLGGVALANSDLYLEGQLMVARILQEDYKRTGLHENDGSRLVDSLRGAEGVKVVALIQERESRKQKGTFRVMLRSSNGGPDISAVARLFGGGGHRGAASFTIEKPLHDVEELLKEAISFS